MLPASATSRVAAEVGRIEVEEVALVDLLELGVEGRRPGRQHVHLAVPDGRYLDDDAVVDAERPRGRVVLQRIDHNDHPANVAHDVGLARVGQFGGIPLVRAVEGVEGVGDRGRVDVSSDDALGWRYRHVREVNVVRRHDPHGHLRVVRDDDAAADVGKLRKAQLFRGALAREFYRVEALPVDIDGGLHEAADVVLENRPLDVRLDNAGGHDLRMVAHRDGRCGQNQGRKHEHESQRQHSLTHGNLL